MAIIRFEWGSSIDLNGNNQWPSSVREFLTITNRHGVAPFDFANVSGCDQLVAGPTHAHGGTLRATPDE